MSDTDSFIDEVTEEVRRDRLFLMFKRYGWIAAVVIIAIVGGAAYNEYKKGQARAAAETLGDDMLAALAQDDPSARATDLEKITAKTPGGEAILDFLIAAAQVNSDQSEDAVSALNEISRNGELPEIYRQIATFKALLLQSESLPASDRRVQFEALAQPGAPLRLLSQEQLALIDISEGQVDAAMDRLQAILQDAEISADLQQRVSQLIVALGGTPQTRSVSQG